jgi:outer membrane protein assembly factor BamA
MSKLIISLVWFFLLLGAHQAMAEVKSTRTWTIIPIVVVNPENGYGAGLKYFDKAWLNEKNYLDLTFYYTIKDQKQVEAEHRYRGIFGSAWNTKTHIEGFDYPESFFGATNQPIDSAEHLYLPKGFSAKQELNYPLVTSLYFKASYYFKNIDMQDIRLGQHLNSAVSIPKENFASDPDWLGYQGGFNDLGDISIEYDSRDFEKQPKQGWYLGYKMGHSFFSEVYQYGWSEAWLAHYLTWHEHWEWAGKVFQKTALGDIPFYEEPYLGDRKLMRGVINKRLRNHSIQALQSELRYQFRLPIAFFHNEWQMAAFGEMGRVGNDLAMASQASPHFSGGIGGRLILGERLALLRGDLGFSQYGVGIYIDFGQAF